MPSAKNHKNRHRLLQRQLRKTLGRNADIPEEWEEFLDLVDETYVHTDEDRKMLERSLDLSSKELIQSNQELIMQKQELEEALEELRSTQQELVASQEMLALSKELEKTHAELLAQKEELEKTHQELLNAQSKLVHAEKMSSLGQLTAGVAHEINNPVNFIYAGIQALKVTVEDLFEEIDYYISLGGVMEPEELQKKLIGLKQRSQKNLLKELKDDLMEMVETVESGASRTAEIVKGLRNFARVDEREAQYAELAELIDSTLVILSTEISRDIEVVKDYGNSPSVFCYPGQLNQVFMNILSNAVQALGEEGTIKISILDKGEEVEIRISDNGPGIPKEILSKVFDPFFTTKEVGKGTGLGLSISYGIIEEQHQGRIRVESKEGKGATFFIALPK